MKILHVDGGRRWGGGQNQVRLLMRELQRAGVAQLCLCPQSSPLAERLQAEGLPCAAIRWQRGLSLRALLAIAGHAKGVDIIHVHDAHALQLAIPGAALRGTPIVAARRMTLPARAAKWNRAARVIAISGAVRDVLVASGVQAAKVRLIHSGIDAAEVRSLPPLEPTLRTRLGLAADAYLVGSVGALEPLKGQTVIAAAAGHLPDAQWVVIGEGSARGALEAAIGRCAVAGRVHLPGGLPDARRALRELDAFVFPSERDALGTSILDAMACNVPVVAAASPGPAEILGEVHAETGCALYPPRDAVALAALVARVRQDEALRSRVIAAQRRRLAAFAVERSAAATLALYEEVLGS